MEKRAGSMCRLHPFRSKIKLLIPYLDVFLYLSTMVTFVAICAINFTKHSKV